MRGPVRSGLAAAILIPILISGSLGCSALISNVTEEFAGNLSAAILGNPDVDVVREGAPAYLILIDGLLESTPDNVTLLSQAASLNSAYAGAFVADGERARLMAEKAKALAARAVCLGIKDGCGVVSRPFVDFERWVAGLQEKDVPLAYGFATSWAGWIQANSDDFNAIAELGRVKALISRVADLDEGFDYGGPHLYLGIFEVLLPPALGGRPEIGRYHFERAIALSEGRHLLTKVMFAEQYAKLVFDRELHDRLLREVLEGGDDLPELRLMNAVARGRARELLDAADDYF